MPVNPKFGQKRAWGVQKWVKKILAIFVKRPIKPLGQIFQTQKTDLKNSSPSYKSLKFEFVQPNSPIIILILLNGFHKIRDINGAKHECAAKSDLVTSLREGCG